MPAAPPGPSPLRASGSDVTPHNISWHDQRVIWFVLLVAVVLVVLTTAAVLGRVDGSLGDATTSLSHEPLPDGPLTPGNLEQLHFDTSMRGYRMNQVDDVIDRLRREISDLDEALSRARPHRVPASAHPSEAGAAPETH